jgi:hypothetical protein
VLVGLDGLGAAPASGGAGGDLGCPSSSVGLVLVSVHVVLAWGAACGGGWCAAVEAPGVRLHVVCWRRAMRCPSGLASMR